MIKISSRQSPLALHQSHLVGQLISNKLGYDYQILPKNTTGDQILDRPLADIGGKGLFVKEVQEALLDGSADIAVHSLKDVPYEKREGLAIVAYCLRDNPFDALVGHKKMAELPANPRIGTGSARRAEQFKELFPDAIFVPLRGNVATRLNKISELNLDGTILAAAGLNRLGLSSKISHLFSLAEMVPAPGQGVLAIEARIDHPLIEEFKSLNDEELSICATAERVCAQELAADCHSALGAYATRKGDEIEVELFYADKTNRFRKTLYTGLELKELYHELDTIRTQIFNSTK